MLPEPTYVNPEEALSKAFPGAVVSTLQTAYMSTEAPAVVFTQLYGLTEGKNGKEVVQFNLTVRANTPEEAIDKLIGAATYGKEKYKLSLARPTVDLGTPPPPAPKPSNTTAPQTPPATKPAPQPSAGSQPASGKYKPGKQPGQYYFDCVKMKIKPDGEGKVNIEWYEAGCEFANIYTTKTVEQAVTILSATGDWTEHMSVVKTYPVNMRVTFTLSEKLTTKGNPYKNILYIDPL